MKRIYHLWKTIGHSGINEEALDTNLDYYIGVDTGNKYPKSEYYISNYFKAKIVAVDNNNETGMYHLYKEFDDNNEENNMSVKSKYIGAIITVRKAHYCDGVQVYYCHELHEYFSDTEIELF